MNRVKMIWIWVFHLGFPYGFVEISLGRGKGSESESGREDLETIGPDIRSEIHSISIPWILEFWSRFFCKWLYLACKFDFSSIDPSVQVENCIIS